MARFIPNGEDQKYLHEKYGTPIVSERQKRTWIIKGIYPEPIKVSPGRNALTDEQLDRYAEEKLGLVKNSAAAA